MIFFYSAEKYGNDKHIRNYISNPLFDKAIDWFYDRFNVQVHQTRIQINLFNDESQVRSLADLFLPFYCSCDD